MGFELPLFSFESEMGGCVGLFPWGWYRDEHLSQMFTSVSEVTLLVFGLEFCSAENQTHLLHMKGMCSPAELHPQLKLFY